jgi:hypothetical protein
VTVPRSRRALRATTALLVTTLGALLLGVGLAAPAAAEEGYEYWNYFHEKNGSWTFSQKGVAQYTPADGSVEGFRYGTSTASQGLEPRADLSEVHFDSVCEGVEAGNGEKRVALVIDFGTPQGHGTPPEPRAECAVVAEDASTQQALDTVGDLRVEDGLTCGIGGYPPQGCGVPVEDAEVPSDEQPVAFTLPSDDTADSAASDAAAESSGSGAPLGLLVAAGALVVVLAVGGLLLARRNRAA